MYKLSQSDLITRLEDNAFIPKDHGNKDYQGYLSWIDAGNTPEPADIITIIPEITPYQIREAMNQLGLRADVEAAISAGDQSLKDLWNYAPSFKRNHPKIAEIATAIGKTDADIDALFTLAATLSP